MIDKMNPLLRELAKEPFQQSVDHAAELDMNYMELFTVLFAEAVVRKCLDSISAHRAEAVDVNLTLDESFSLLINDIKNTFGVE